MTSDPKLKLLVGPKAARRGEKRPRQHTCVKRVKPQAGYRGNAANTRPRLTRFLPELAGEDAANRLPELPIKTAFLPFIPLPANNNKFLSDFGIRNGSRLQADDFLQDYTLLVNVLHTCVPRCRCTPALCLGNRSERCVSIYR